MNELSFLAMNCLKASLQFPFFLSALIGHFCSVRAKREVATARPNSTGRKETPREHVVIVTLLPPLRTAPSALAESLRQTDRRRRRERFCKLGKL